MADECGYDTYGIVHILHCPSCGAEVTYIIPLENEDESKEETGDN